MKLAACQLSPTDDFSKNAENVARLTAEAAQEGADLVLFPEGTMVSPKVMQGDLARYAGEHWADFVEVLKSVSADNDVVVVAGGYEPAPDRPYNTILAVKCDGRVLAAYRKIHLFDAFDGKESARVRPGAAGPTTFELGGHRFGIVNCYDIRFPEMSRALVDQGADVLLVSAAWAPGPRKLRHWSTLLAARAIENTCWVVASGVGSPQCLGHSAIIDPLGDVRAQAEGAGESLLLHTIDNADLIHARQVLPSLLHRRLR